MGRWTSRDNQIPFVKVFYCTALCRCMLTKRKLKKRSNYVCPASLYKCIVKSISESAQMDNFIGRAVLENCCKRSKNGQSLIVPIKKMDHVRYQRLFVVVLQFRMGMTSTLRLARIFCKCVLQLRSNKKSIKKITINWK